MRFLGTFKAVYLSFIVQIAPTCKLRAAFCLFSFCLFLLVGYYHFIDLYDSGPKTAGLYNSSPSHKKRIERVCREWGITGKIPAMFVPPADRWLPCDPAQVSPSNHEQKMNSEEVPITSHFHLASNYKTMGCFVNKVASSSFVSAFLRIQGFTSFEHDPHAVSDVLLPKSLQEFEMANLTYFKFMIVRHPMDRMLSAYLDKMANFNHVEKQLVPYRSCIKERGRKVILNRNANNQSLHTLPNCTIEEASQLSYMLPEISNNASSIDIPTFEQFLEFVLSTDLHGLTGYEDAAHSHWVPFHRYCSPCSIKFDAIGKLEIAANDFEHIWHESGLHKSGVKIPGVNIQRANKPSHAKSELEERYYSSLPRELILRFYNTFRMDFELFDYSINEILFKAGYPPVMQE